MGFSIWKRIRWQFLVQDRAVIRRFCLTVSGRSSFSDSLYGGAAILFWLPLFYGHLTTFSVFLPVDWHVHEMLFGYLAAIMTGFLLTAIPNWTGLLPVQGLPLLALVLLWLAGQLAVFFLADTGWLVGAAVD